MAESQRRLQAWYALLALAGAACTTEQARHASAPDSADATATTRERADSVGPDRTVAVTFDDLPGIVPGGLEAKQRLTRQLLDQIRAADIPAIGFVNEQQLDVAGEKTERIALLEAWLDAGLDLGNHTYSHPSLFDTPLEEFQDDVLRGERVTRPLLEARGHTLRYFRHPFLNTGPDLATKEAFERFLTEHDYVVAPVTIDNDEWRYAAAYNRAITSGDSVLRLRIGHDYIRYMDEVFAFYEELSRTLLGREPAQVLLLHANALNADWLDELAAMMRARGYRFVTLAQALQDPAYALPDRYTGRTGPSWLQRWARTRGVPAGEQPEAGEWVRGS